MMIIFISGFLGSTFDSVLGSTLQGKFNCFICNKTVENEIHCGKNSVHTNGVKWLNNDAVNFAASLFGGFMSLALANLIL